MADDLWADYFKAAATENALFDAKEDDKDREMRRSVLQQGIIRDGLKANINPQSITDILDTSATPERLKRAFADIIKNDPANVEKYAQQRGQSIDRNAIAQANRDARDQQIADQARLRSDQQKQHDERMAELARGGWDQQNRGREDRQAHADEAAATAQTNRLIIRNTPQAKGATSSDEASQHLQRFKDLGFSSIAAVEGYAIDRLTARIAQGGKIDDGIKDLATEAAPFVRDYVAQGMGMDQAVAKVVTDKKLAGLKGGSARDALKRLQAPAAPAEPQDTWSGTAMGGATDGSVKTPPGADNYQISGDILDRLVKKHTAGDSIDVGALAKDVKAQLAAEGEPYTKEIAAAIKQYLQSLGGE